MRGNSCCCRADTPEDLVIVLTLGWAVAGMCCKMSLAVLVSLTKLRTHRNRCNRECSSSLTA